MQLTPAQLKSYRRDGFLILPELFSPAEVAVLRDEVARCAAIDTDCIVREGESGAPKIMFRMHETDGPTASAPMRALACSLRALGVTQQVLGDEALYLHHSKVNMKQAIEGSIWPWHQDYQAWHLDGIERPDIATFLVMLGQASQLGGCMYVIPGSHRGGLTREGYYDQSTAYGLWAMPRERLAEVIAECGEPVPVAGPPGTAMLFHCNLLHCSGHNLSAEDRCHVFLCYNPTANRPKDVDDPRPDYVRSRNWAPLPLMPDDAILTAAAAAA